MSWGINPNATEKEKIFADYNDNLIGMNSSDGLSYHHYSQLYDIGRNLADREYQQGKVDGFDEFFNAIKEHTIVCNDDVTEIVDIMDIIKCREQLEATN